MNARAASFRITARSDGLSTSELTKLLNQLRADLEALRASVNRASHGTVHIFNAAAGNTSELSATTASLRADLDKALTQLGQSDAELSSTRAELQVKIGALGEGVSAAKSELQTQLSDLSALQSTLARVDERLTSAEGRTTVLTADLGGLMTTVGDLR